MFTLFTPPTPTHSTDPVENHRRMLRALTEAAARGNYSRTDTERFDRLRAYASEAAHAAVYAKRSR